MVSYDPYAESSRADAGVYGSGIDWSLLMQEKRTLLEKFHVAETISGAGPSRLLWFRKSENLKPKGNRPVDKAMELVAENLRKQGHSIQTIIETTPSNTGCRLSNM